LAVIELEKVSKKYRIGPQTIDALREVDLVVERGQQMAVTGRSGSGKSTLLHVIGTLDRPSSGHVKLNGTDVSRLPDKMSSYFRNCSVGFVFQMNNLLAEFNALENVMMPGIIAGMSRASVRARAEELLGAVGLSERIMHRPSELSGGEQQRVAIARALVMAPPILLCDEPTGNLDKATSLQIEKLLLDLCREHDVTMLLVTHDPEIAERLPQQIIMEDGRLLSARGTN